jgi:hypothetical protein
MVSPGRCRLFKHRLTFDRLVDFPTPFTPTKTTVYGRPASLAAWTSRRISMERFGVRMRNRASSIAACKNVSYSFKALKNRFECGDHVGLNLAFELRIITNRSGEITSENCRCGDFFWIRMDHEITVP